MVNLTAAVKAKIGSYGAEFRQQANNKCLEARMMVQEAAGQNDASLMLKAVDIYIEAINIFPRLIEPYISIAYICWKFKEFDKAVMLLNSAIEIDPLSNNARDMLAKISKEKKNSHFSKLKEKYRGGPLSEKIKAREASKQGLISKFFGLFTGSTAKTGKAEPALPPKKKDDFAESLAEFSKMMNYEQLKIKVDKNTLSRINGVMQNKEVTPHQTVKASPEREEQAVITGFDKEQLKQMSAVSREKLQEKQESLSKEQFVVRVNRDTFSKITGKKIN
jgi:tetratricopeptide (TPR) repeat protein